MKSTSIDFFCQLVVHYGSQHHLDYRISCIQQKHFAAGKMADRLFKVLQNTASASHVRQTAVSVEQQEIRESQAAIDHQTSERPVQFRSGLRNKNFAQLFVHRTERLQALLDHHPTEAERHVGENQKNDSACDAGRVPVG